MYDLAQILNIVLPSGIVSIFCVIFKFPHSRLSIFSHFFVPPLFTQLRKLTAKTRLLLWRLADKKAWKSVNTDY